MAEPGPEEKMSAQKLIDLLRLQGLEGEGGYFRRTWTSPLLLPDGRPGASAIYFLLTGEKEGFSAFHVLDADEVYHYYAGCPAELHTIDAEGRHSMTILGPELSLGQLPQALVPAGVLQASRCLGAGPWTLLGTTMTPAFVPECFNLASRSELIQRYPELSEYIYAFTRA